MGTDPETGSEAASGDPPTVLVVDDQPNVADAYALWLSEEYDVRTATSGEAALTSLADDPDVDAVLLDRRMPDLSGDEVLATLRERGIDCRVAMVTAVDPDFDIADMDVDAYLTKPVGADELRAVVEQLLRVATYDDRARERFALAERRAALEAEKTSAELRDSEEYARLTRRIEELGEAADEAFEGMALDEFAHTFGDADVDEN
jgi:DNA-binding response OmpR family regulator